MNIQNVYKLVNAAEKRTGLECINKLVIELKRYMKLKINPRTASQL